MAASPFVAKRTYKPGGTSILSCNAITTQIKSHTRDRMGRWTSLAITTNCSTLRIISAYQVCLTTSKGTVTASAQQEAQIMLETGMQQSLSCRSPRQAFIQDLQSFIMQSQALNEAIILVGDFNEDINDPRAGMRTLAETCGLVDLFATRLGSSSIPATYSRGQKRLDYVLVSPSITQCVQAAGYEPFGYRIPSNHRGIYIDFSTKALFQSKIPSLVSQHRREFSSKTPGVVNMYVTAKMKYLRDHKFFGRLEQLMTQEVPNNELAEALDRDLQRAAHHAAKMCARKKRPPWSPKLAMIWATLHFYRLARSEIKTQANHIPALTKLQEQWAHLPRQIPTDIQLITMEYQTAIQNLKSVQAQARQLRDEYLLQKAEVYHLTDDNRKSRAIQRILRAETQRQVHKKLRDIRRPDGNMTGLSQLKIPVGISPTDSNAMKRLPDTPEYWETVTVPRSIEEILLARNGHHFGQAKDTPFAQPPLQMQLGYKADGVVVDTILEGTYRSQGSPVAAQLLIKYLQQRSTSVLEGTITPTEIVAKLKGWREDTTTSPSGIHLGHYHCLWRHPTSTGDSEQDDSIKRDQKRLLQATADLMNYAIRYGYSYTRWTKIVNIMLQKDAGNPRVHRLRVIHIYEADYNLLLAVKWRQALHHAEDEKILNDGLYGSRPGRTAHDPVLLEVLHHEIYRMSMKTGINFDLDATSCYDRILVNIASMCSRRVGMHQTIVFVNALTLEKARYHLKTILGISDGSYTHCSDHPIFGTGQGSGNSPTIWCFVCSTLFDAIESATHGATFVSYNKQYRVQIYMIGFVDDYTQRVNLFEDDEQPNTNRLTRLMERDAQKWNDLLWASGGALEQSKCSYHLIQSAWTEDGQPFLQGGTQGSQLQLFDGRQYTVVPQKSSYDSHKTLGCYINPAHNSTSTWLDIKTKNEKLAMLLETNHLSRSETWVFYTSIYIPSLTYSIPMNPLTKQQCIDINSRISRALLPCLGYNRNMATELRYTPRSMGGVGLQHLYHAQGTLLLQHVFKYLNSPATTIGKMLRITLTWTQAFAGTSEMILSNVTSPLPPIGPSILLDLRQFLSSVGAQLTMVDLPSQPLLRQHDRFIMDVALSQTRWRRRQMIQINACRRYLQALTLADISTPTGTRLTASAKSAHESPSSDILRVSRFNQKKPGLNAWRTWQKFLRTISNKDGLLYQPLGAWIVLHTQTRMRQQYIHDPITNQLYSQYQGEMYQAHDNIGPSHFAITPTTSPQRARGYPTTVIILQDRLFPLKNYKPLAPPPVIFHPSTETYHPSWQMQLLAGVQNLQPKEVPYTGCQLHYKVNKK